METALCHAQNVCWHYGGLHELLERLHHSGDHRNKLLQLLAGASADDSSEKEPHSHDALDSPTTDCNTAQHEGPATLY